MVDVAARGKSAELSPELKLIREKFFRHIGKALSMIAENVLVTLV